MIYGNKFLPKEEISIESASIKDFGIESIAYNEYCNISSLLESCTDDKTILEAQVQVLYEVSIKDIFNKIKEIFKAVKRFIEKIIGKFKLKILSLKKRTTSNDSFDILKKVDIKFNVDNEAIKSKLKSLQENNITEEGLTIFKNLAENNPATYFLIQDYINESNLYDFSDVLPILSKIGTLDPNRDDFNDLVFKIIDELEMVEAKTWDTHIVLVGFKYDFEQKLKQHLFKNHELNITDINWIVDNSIYMESRQHPIKNGLELYVRHKEIDESVSVLDSIFNNMDHIERNIDRIENTIDNIVNVITNAKNGKARSSVQNIYKALTAISKNMRLYLNICSVLMSKCTHSINVYNFVRYKKITYEDNSASNNTAEKKLS